MCKLCKPDAVVLNNSCVNAIADLYIGGLSSGRDYHDKKAIQMPDVRFIDEYERL